jgi:hypothetical protein
MRPQQWPTAAAIELLAPILTWTAQQAQSQQQEQPPGG